MASIGDQTVIAIQRVQRVDDASVPVRDGYGNPLYDEVRTAVEGCAVQPGQSTESNQNARQTVSVATVYAPLTWPAGSNDAAETDDGRRWDIDGVPQRWIFGALSHIEVRLREVVG